MALIIRNILFIKANHIISLDKSNVGEDDTMIELPWYITDKKHLPTLLSTK